MVACYWWQSGLFKGRARELAKAHCQQHDLQFLDDSVVITGFWPIRNASGQFVFRRSYLFEFASTGDQRYQGRLILEGMKLASVDLDTYKIPPLE